MAAAADREDAPGESFILFEHGDFEPPNPLWMKEAAAWRPDALPAALMPQPPPEAFLPGDDSGGEPPLCELPFGGAAARRLFALDGRVAYLNHGSYGATFAAALAAQRAYTAALERNAVAFMEGPALAGSVAAAAEVAALVGAEWRDVVLVPNATAACAAAINAVPPLPAAEAPGCCAPGSSNSTSTAATDGTDASGSGDVIVVNTLTYGAVRSAAARRAAESGAALADVRLGLEHLAGGDDAVVRQFELAFEALRARGRRPRLVVLDHVASFPPVVMPVARLAALAARLAPGARVLVDGAHSVGTALPDLNVAALADAAAADSADDSGGDSGVDWYVSNLHKWACAPKGCAFLWSNPDPRRRTPPARPLVTSHGYGLGLRAEWLWSGTQGAPTAWLAARVSLRMLQALGGRGRCAGYNRALAARAAARLRAAFATRHQLPAPGQPSAGMAAVELPWPLRVPGAAEGGGQGEGGEQAAAAGTSSSPPPTAAVAAALNRHLRSAHDIEVPVIAAAGRLWVRISAQIYNNDDDYERLAAAVLLLVPPPPPPPESCPRT